MILTGSKIIYEQNSGKLSVHPFCEDAVNPNSIDVRLGAKLLSYKSPVLDLKEELEVEQREIGGEGYLIRKGQFVLAHTEETIGSDYYVPMIHGKSSLARAGLFIHLCTGLVQLGTLAQLTLQLYAVCDIRLYAGMPIAQISFWTVDGAKKLYDGRYQGAVGPQQSLLHSHPFWTRRADENGS